MTTKNEQLKLPEPGGVMPLTGAPVNWAMWVKGITAKRYKVTLAKTPRRAKKD